MDELTVHLKLPRNLLKVALLLLILPVGCSNQLINQESKSSVFYRYTISELESQERILWRQVMQPLLADPLWQERDAYDAGHYLMLPLHGAFASNYQPWIDDFENFFQGFTNNYADSDFDSIKTLTKLHFLYLASEYMVLLKEQGKPVPEQLLEIVTDSLESVWRQPAWQWSRSPFPGGMAERLEWKLSNKTVSQSYYRAIIDEELFSFAIAANLKSISTEQSPSFIDKILNLAYKVLEEEIVFIDANSERWLIQPGVWTDHPDYAYVGWKRKARHPDKKLIPGIASDSSHSHRFPLLLVSLQRGFEAKGQEKRVEYIEKLQRGLAVQFTEKVLVPPSNEFPNYRTTNFMDGHNGIYRYNYETDTTGLGYGLYELSSTMLLGWWRFLPDPDHSIQDAYCFMAAKYPLSSQEMSVYLGRETTRDRHPLIKGKAPYENGFLELINRLACKLKER